MNPENPPISRSPGRHHPTETVSTPAEFFADNDLGLEVFHRVEEILEDFGECEVRVTKSQIAFRSSRGFAYLWAPAKWLKDPDAKVVLSIALGRHDGSDRWKEVSHPSARHWMHHLEIRALEDIDSEVFGWLVEAANRAA